MNRRACRGNRFPFRMGPSKSGIECARSPVSKFQIQAIARRNIRMENVSHFWELILGTVIALLPLINPLASAPTFLAITEGDTHERRMQQLGMACVYMVGILVCFLIGGTFIMG